MVEASSEDSTATVYIVDLPDHLILHILSFLPSTLDAAQTGLVCRKWRNLWRSLPSLHFSQTLFPRYNTPQETLQCFTDFINQTLILRFCKSSILRFCLQFPVIEQQHVYHVNSWIRYAVNNGVLHLDIDTYKWGFHDTNIEMNNNGLYVYYEFPLSVLRNSCVRVLKLSCCDLWLPANSLFDSLRSVTLDRVKLTGQMFSDFMLACVNLEDLVLECISSFEVLDLKICSQKLRKLLIKGFNCAEGSVDVDAPNLVSLTIDWMYLREYAFKKMESLVELKFFMRFEENWSKFILSHGNVKHLFVVNSWLKFVGKDVPSEGFVLNNLNTLVMYTGFEKSYLHGIAAICERSHNLETLILFGFIPLEEEEIVSEEDMKSISFNVPKLKQVKMKEFRGATNELLFITHMEKHGVVLEKIVITPANRLGVSLDGLKQLKLSKDILHVRQCGLN